jgi:hypothetical protein
MSRIVTTQSSLLKGISLHFFGVRNGLHFAALRHSQDPSLDLRHGAFGRRQAGLKESGECTVLVGAGEPVGDTVGIMLVSRAV